jgi:hypothetical protein
MTVPSRGIVAAFAVVLSLSVANPGRAQQPAPEPDASRIDVTATDYAFRAPESAPSGWTRIRFTNEGAEPHFIFMSRLPEGRSIEDYERDISPVFAGALEAVRSGATPDVAMQTLMEKLPAWFPELHFVGGPGLASPGVTTQATLRLEPGNYVLECYIKTEDGRIHYMEGMVRPFTVTQQASALEPPTADVTVTLTNDGMAFDGDVAAGRRTFRVHWEENPEQGFGHSAHLARLDDGASVEDVVAWMNWFSNAGLAAPAPVEFIGGLHFMPTGATAYFTADLEPGRYLLISENTAHLGVHREFIVQ